MIDKDLEGNIRKYYVYSFFSILQFYGPIFLLFFQSFGFSLTQILFFLTVYSVSVLIFEVPSGILSDYIGRKKSLVLFGVTIFLSFFTITIGTSYEHFLLAYFLMGLARSLESGADTAIVYDTLLKLRKEKDFQKIQGTAVFYERLAIFISFIIGGFLFAIAPRLPYALTTIGVAVVIPVALGFKEPPRKKIHMHVHKHAINSIKIFVKSPQIRWLSLFSALVTTGYVLNFFVNQQYLKIVGASAEIMGLILAVSLIVAAFAGKEAYKIESRLREKGSLILMVIFLAAGYFLMSQFSFFAAFIFLYFISFVEGFSRPILSDYVNKHFASQNRATMLSLNNFVAKVSFAIFAPILGFLSDNYSLQNAFLIMAIAIVLIGVLIIPFVVRAHVKHKKKNIKSLFLD